MALLIRKIVISSILLIAQLCLSFNASANTLPAVTRTIPISDLIHFSSYSPTVKTLINKADALTQKNLTYLYGSSDPKNKGMDCSGTIYYLLKSMSVNDAPRQANEMYVWAEQSGHLIKTTSQDFNSAELKQLKPGDLLFWTGTYAVKRTPNITHVMIYLGMNADKKPLMFGASNGRTYKNKKMWGVSVFDFKLSNGGSGKFVGYSCIPHLTCEKNN